MIYYYTKKYHPFFNSFGRYLKYNLGFEIQYFSGDTNLEKDNATIFVYKEERTDADFLDKLVMQGNYRIISIGCERNAALDISDLTNIKKSIQNILTNNLTSGLELFTEDELKNVVKGLFKSHGTESILKLINNILYAVNNFSYYDGGGISKEDYIQQFVLPASRSWADFIKRLSKNEPFFKMLKLTDQLAIIKRMIAITTPFMTTFPSIIQSSSSKNVTISEEIEKNKECLSKIDETLLEISTILGIGDGQI